MSTRQVQPQRGASLLRGALDQFNAIAQDAARTDQAGRWGVDGWIRLIHNVLDLQMRSWATAVDIGLAGPSWWLEPAATDPGPSDPIPVKSESYPRTLSVVKPFVRVGRPDVRVPDGAIRFVPDVLPAGGTSFQIRMDDQRFVGASYLGTVRLRRADGTARDSSTVSFTVGL